MHISFPMASLQHQDKKKGNSNNIKYNEIYNQFKNNVRYVVMQMHNGPNFRKIFLCAFFFPQMIIPETKLINTVGMSS